MDKVLIQEQDAQKLLDAFKKDVSFRDALLSDPAKAAGTLGVGLSPEAVAAIRRDAGKIREELGKKPGSGVLEPTLVRIVRWTS